MDEGDPERDTLDPASMAPEERAHEVAAILARGYLRQMEGAALATAPLSPRAPENSLEQSGDHAPPCAPGERPARGRTRKEVRQ